MRSGASRHPESAPAALLVLAVLGLAVALYVAWGSYTGSPLRCVAFDGCNEVARSPYARVFGVPFSYLGVLYYGHMAALAALLLAMPRSRGLRVAAAAYAAAGVAYSGYAAYVQLAWIHAACSYCLISALITVTLLFIAVGSLRADGAVRLHPSPGISVR